MELEEIVKSGLCTGCGACVAVNPRGLKMSWEDHGFLIPHPTTDYVPDKEEQVCPFNLNPAPTVLTEDELAELCLSDAPHKEARIGRYTNFYIGYSKKYRMTSSSGGLATSLAEQLLRKKYVDAMVTVVETGSTGPDRFKFQLITDPERVETGSKTKYYPVTYADILQEIAQFSGKVAITGVPCFIKAIRLLQYYNPIYKEKIAFTIGIICGGMKSAFFSDYLAQKAGVEGAYRSPEFRVKNPDSDALDYSYRCEDEVTGEKNSVRMRTVGDMWGSGYFKSLACDLCDDVTNELADISLGDAWLPEYRQDGRGQNVIVTRSALADLLVGEGMSSGQLEVKDLSMDRFLRSQRGSYNHRHKGLKYRISKLRKQGVEVPPKRYDTEDIPCRFRWVQNCRANTRAKSLSVWRDCKDATLFERRMAPYKGRLSLATEIYHLDRLPRQIGCKFRHLGHKSR